LWLIPFSSLCCMVLKGHCATSPKVVGSIADNVIGIFQWHNPSGRTMALGLTQPLTEMSTRGISWGVKAELNPICHLLAFLGAHHILHVSRVRDNWGNLHWFLCYKTCSFLRLTSPGGFYTLYIVQNGPEWFVFLVRFSHPEHLLLAHLIQVSCLAWHSVPVYLSPPPPSEKISECSLTKWFFLKTCC